MARFLVHGLLILYHFLSHFQMWLGFWFTVCWCNALVIAQKSNNYEQQAISITLEDEEEGHLPVFGTLNGTVTELDTIPATIMLKKTKAELTCSGGYMNVQMTFGKPFYGIVYPDFDRNSACKIVGDGATSSQIKLPLKGCGTLQVCLFLKSQRGIFACRIGTYF